MRVAACVLASLVACGCGSSEDDAAPPDPAPAPHACSTFRKEPPKHPPSTTCRLPIGGSGSTVRVFAAGNRQDVVAHATYEDFCESIDRIMREQIVPCLASDKPNFVVWPEDAVLAAAFLGARGAKARQRKLADVAFLDIAGAYSKAIQHYQLEHTGLSTARQLSLALTDVTWRVLHGVFAAQAKHYRVHVAVSGNVAEPIEVTDPALRQKLGDPEHPEGPVWAAKNAEVHNVGIVFAPDGKIVGVERKAYLTPAEEDTLDLSYGALPQLAPLELPFARAGAAISKDAWMPLVRDRFEAWGTDLALQYEAFSGWAVEERPGDWNPDVLMESGPLMTARAGAVRYVATPCLTGNLLDLVFDCQSHVAKVPSPDDVPLAFIGNPKRAGFASMGAWAAPNWSSLSREELRAWGETLKQGGSRENQYAESVAVADLALSKEGVHAKVKGTGTPGALGASSVLRASSLPQRHVALAARGDDWAAAWEEGSAGGGSIVVLLAKKDAPAKIVTFPGPKARLPSIAFDGAGRIAVAFESDRGDDGRVLVAISDVEGTFGAPRVVPGPAPQWMPAVAGDPKAARFFVAWADLRDGGRSHVYVAGEDLAPVRVDPKHENGAKPTRGDEWSPRLGVDAVGALHVVWTDFREYAWDIRYARSSDGKTFASSLRVNDETKKVGTPPVELERLHADPTVAIDDTGAAIVAWSALEDRRPHPWTAYDVATAGVFGTDVVVAGPKPTCPKEVPPSWCRPTSFAQPEIVPTADGPRFVGAIDGVVSLAAKGAIATISDSPAGAHAARPRAVKVGGTLLVAWEDDREGVPRIRFVRGALP